MNKKIILALDVDLESALQISKKLKDDMETFSNRLKEANSLITNYNLNQELLNEIKASLRNYFHSKLIIK